MKPKIRPAFLNSVLITCSALLLPSAAHSQILYWAAPVNGLGNRDGAWNQTTPNWLSYPGAPANISWLNFGSAIANFTFPESATVSTGTMIRLRGIYSDTMAPVTISGVPPLSFNGASSITVMNGPLFINSTITNFGGILTKSGTGLLAIGGSVTTNALIIQEGLVSLSGGNLVNSAEVRNSSVLIMDDSDTISKYTQSSGTLTGSGTLTATNGATLSSGAVAGTLSANTTVTGDVEVSGSIGGGSLTIESGELTLSGSSTNPRIDILANGGLIDVNGGLGSDAAVFNSGNLSLNSDDTILSYQQESGGVLTGTGTLAATGGATLNGGTVSGKLSAKTVVNGDVAVTGSLGGGTLTVSAGTLTLSGISTNGRIDVSTGAMLVDAAGGLNGSEVSVSNSGTLKMNADDVIQTYTQNPGGTLSGTSTLTVSKTAVLDGGTVSGNLSGPINSHGDVLASGSIGGGNLIVSKGTLTLSGTSTNPVIDILRGATLRDTDGGLNAINANVTNFGTLEVSANDTIQKYTQSGGELRGSGTLTVTGSATLSRGTISGNLIGAVTSIADVLVSGSVGGSSLVINNGIFNLTGTAGSRSITINNGNFINANGGLSDAATVTNNSSFVVNADDTVFKYTQQGFGEMSGTGTLTVTHGITLNGGTIKGRLSGDVTVNGKTVVVGGIDGSSLSIQSGTLYLNGASTHQNITISTGGQLHDANGGLETFAKVTNSGELRVISEETVSEYTQHDGTLDGGGILTAGNRAILGGGSIAGHLWSPTTTVQGEVLVSGKIDGNDLTIDGRGALALSGVSTQSNIGILDSGSMRISGGSFDPAANIINESRLTLDTDATISSYTQRSGPWHPTLVKENTLEGAGTLTVTGAAILEGGTVSGNLTGNVRVLGNVMVSGHIGGGTLTVEGQLGLTGSSSHATILNSLGTLENSNSGFADGAEVVNAGVLVLHADDTVRNYTQAGRPAGMLQGEGVLTVTGTAVLEGGKVSAGISGNVTCRGDVEVSGGLGGGNLLIENGILDLTGSSANDVTTIASGATLKNSGNLGDTSHITNFGTLSVNAGDTIGRLFNNGGLVDGSGRLIVSGPVLFNGGELAGKLSATSGAVLNGGTLISGELLGAAESRGDVTISGSTGGGNLVVADGSLKLTGTVDSFTHIKQGAGLIGNGRIKGILLNEGKLTTLTEGGRTLKIDGSLANLGLVSMTVTDAGHHDQIKVGGTASLGGSLLVANNGAGLESGEVAELIKADSFNGGFEDFQTIGFENAVIFDDSTGRLIGMASGRTMASKRYLNLNATQTDVYLSLYEDAVETGEQNVTPGGDSTKRAPRATKAAGQEDAIEFTSGLSDGDAQLVDALNLATFTDPGSIYQPVINRLSPEVHRGMADYTEQATRSHVREATDAAPVSRSGKTQVFATAHSSMEGVDSGRTEAGYDLQMTGFTSGARHDFDKLTRIGGFFGWDDGTIQGALIDTEGHGFTLGAFASRILDEKRATTLTASLAYGGYDFNATRHSFQGDVSSDDIGSNALELALGARTTAYQNNRLLVSPNAAVRFMDGSVDGFVENGAGVPLRVGGQDIESLLLDLGVDVEYKPVDDVTLAGNIGYVKDFGDSGEPINASFAASGANGRPFSAAAPGINDDAIVLGLGICYDLNDRVRASMTYRGDIRMDSQDAHNFGVGLSIGF